jgi:hypothetical protein
VQLRPGTGQILSDARRIPVPGNVLGEGVDLGGRETQGLGHDPDRRAGAHGVDVGHHSHVFRAESLVDVFITSSRREEQKSMSMSGILRRLGLRNRSNSRLWRIGPLAVISSATHDGIASGPPAAARDAFGARPPDDVVHHQEIMAESHLLDHAELFFEKLHRAGWYRLVAAGDAPEAALREERIGGLTGRHIHAREVEAAQLEVDVAAGGDVRCCVEGRRPPTVP